MSRAIKTKPNIGQQYDDIAAEWNAYHFDSDYGTAQLQRALKFAKQGGTALDIGCGAGGRLIRLLESANFKVTGIDASKNMIALAKANHPDAELIQADIRDWKTVKTFDFILAWDSLFHLPITAQKPVLEKLCRLLSKGGVIMHTLGDDTGEHKDVWKEQTFHYSSIGIASNLKILHEGGLTVRHVELDQYPEKHAFIIAQNLCER